MDTKHTPGPWRLSTTNPRAVNGDRKETAIGIANTHGTNDSNYAAFFPSVAEAEANARLIAAAPELLEALRDMLPGADAMGWDTAKARAAIAKATGTTI